MLHYAYIHNPMTDPKKELQDTIDAIFDEASQELDKLELERDAILARCAAELDAKKANDLLKKIINDSHLADK